MKKKAVKWATGLLVLLVAAAMAIGYHFYQNFFSSAVDQNMAASPLYVATGSTADDVLNLLIHRGIATRPELTAQLMAKKNYAGDNVEPGRYTLTEGMSLNAVINQLRGGRGEEMVRLTFHTARTLPELAGRVARNIEADSASIANLLTDPATARKYGFNSSTFLSMFLPDTYFSEWDEDAQGFVDRMASEYKSFWDAERVAKAKALGMTQSQVVTLASIVQAEQQNHPSERPVIAGLYLNRLRKGMKLQSDPTVVFAIGDFNINRVLTTHLAVNSPYNTYLFAGLPPGPINIPQKSSIDAVLNPDSNDYLFMCAKADFSGTHAFAKTLSEHNRNAAAYRQALNERNIFK